MEVTDAESSQSLENNFSEHPLSRECKTEDTEGREHEPVIEEPEIEDPESDIEPPESISLGLSTEDGLCCEVTLNVNIALAIPNAEDDDSVTAVEKTKKKCKKSVPNTVIEAPKAQSYYHIEYNLLPHDPEPTKVDLVMFGLAAKLYKGNKSKVLKPWIEDDKTWLTWTQSVRLNVTKEMLIKLVHHKVTFRVWDTKDHMSSTAKHDRPKGFRLPAEKNDEGSPDHFGTKNMILRLRDNFGKESLKMKQVGESMQYELRKTSYDMHCATAEPKSSNADVANERAASSTAVTQEPQYTTRSADQGRDQESPLDSRGTQDQLKDSKQFSQRAFPVQANKRFNLRRNTIFKASLANSDYIRKHGAATAELSFIYLLAGEKSLTGSLLTRSKGVLEGMCNLTLDKPLISGEMKAMLNPLVITILSATRLPSTPVPFYKLEEYCLPVYCQYKFHNTKRHKTKGYEHSSHICFKDVNVIFTGLISQGELIEYLHGSPLEIEVHDRDRKGDSPPKSPTIFGRSPQDNLLSNVALINSKGIAHDPFKPVKPRHPHGVARLSFAELLNGHRSLRYSLAICSSAPPQILGKDQAQWESKMLEVAGARNDPQTDCMPMGHYLESNSQLNVQVEIACPINIDNITATEEECPFGRIVHLMKHDNVGALSRLCAEILRVNAAAFQLKSKAEEAMQRALGCYKVTTQEMESRELDFLTGFHLLDKNMHLFVIEGLKDGAIRRLWEMSSTKSDGIDWRQITTLYNSALSFSKRLYDCLDLSFCPIYLHEPLEAIMRRPLVYVRDMVPHACFQGLSRLSQLCQVSLMKDAVRNSLFPTCEMVLSLSKEFGSLPEKGQQILERICQSAQGAPERQRGRVRSNPPIENYNQEYVEWKELVATQQLCGGTKDFVQANIDEVQRASQRAQKPKPAVVVAEVEEGKMAHNYSIQTLNSSAQAKELLCKEMAKAPRQRFTYSQEFQSATFQPCDVEAERKAAEGRSRGAWRTPNGFTYPGFQSSIEANEHPKMPDEARINELRKPWRENILHDNTLRPTLSRGAWPWERRSEDFELYIKPPPVFLPKPPVTIHLAGDLLKEEQLEAARAQYKRWLWKILPDKCNTDSHRVPQFKFHLEKDGLDKHILNNQPKYALANTRTLRKTAPAVTAPEVASKERQRRVACVPDGLESDGEQNQSRDPSAPYNKNNPFRGYWRPHSFQYKREVQPLTEEELEVYRFRRRSEAAAPPRPTARRVRPAGNVYETRTHRAVVLHLH
ncbi:hypothetical protein AALO_G00140210 [Alosa alosa]|uniref:DUF4550 domain-containing protein n=1 Tax=Alosa alosa TaxID=278164 RepID=A0AAV6GPL5_9TELE|nr:uncharacterized protein cfap92 isoform X1 [Alosa alosa]KAG5274796.1 hypothetical protein AALO_G00140210 [Alosa alosa]